MNKRDTTRFLTLRAQIQDELEEIERETDSLEMRRRELNRRHGELTSLLDGSVELPEKAASKARYVSGGEAVEMPILDYLAEHPGSSKQQIVAALEETVIDAKREVSLAMVRLRSARKIYSEGARTQAVWYLFSRDEN